MSQFINHIPFIVKSALSFLILFFISVLIHEFAHIIFALVLNVSIKSFTLFDPLYAAPAVVTESSQNILFVKIIGYSGGLISGALYLAILIIKRRWFSHSIYRWILGCSLLTIGLWELSIGIIEGSFHSIYVNDASSSSGISYFVAYIAAISGIALYSFTMPPPTQSRTGKRRAAQSPRIVRPSLLTKPDNNAG